MLSQPFLTRLLSICLLAFAVFLGGCGKDKGIDDVTADELYTRAKSAMDASSWDRSIGLYKALGGGWIDASPPQMVPEDLRRSMQQRSDWGALLSDPLPAGTANPPQAPETSPHEQ